MNEPRVESDPQLTSGIVASERRNKLAAVVTAAGLAAGVATEAVFPHVALGAGSNIPARVETSPQPPAGNKIEHGSDTYYVAFNGLKRLDEALLPEQLISVERATSNYITEYVKKSAHSANILSTKLNKNGSIDFTVKVNGTKKKFTAEIQRPSVDLLFFSVLGTDYRHVPLYPFAQGN
ncbi:MAG: hypothetical protein ACREGG_03305 [Candidatus Saccharimonadales bacterium]